MSLSHLGLVINLASVTWLPSVILGKKVVPCLLCGYLQHIKLPEAERKNIYSYEICR